MKNRSTKSILNQLVVKFQSQILNNTRAIKGGNTGYTEGFDDGYDAALMSS